MILNLTQQRILDILRIPRPVYEIAAILDLSEQYIQIQLRDLKYFVEWEDTTPRTYKLRPILPDYTLKLSTQRKLENLLRTTTTGFTLDDLVSITGTSRDVLRTQIERLRDKLTVIPPTQARYLIEDNHD